MTQQVMKFESTRYVRGEYIAKNKKVYKIKGMELWYVQSETKDDVYYTVMFKEGAPAKCSCFDSSRGHNMCKHQYACVLSDVDGTVNEVNSLPTSQGLEIIH